MCATLLLLSLFFVSFIYYYHRHFYSYWGNFAWRWGPLKPRRFRGDPELGGGGWKSESEGLVPFPGGEKLTVAGILEAPGQVVGKSPYATLYRAAVRVGSGMTVPMLLRFVKPGCCSGPDVVPAARTLGAARHPNLVPLVALYVGPRGEKLLVHPFYAAGALDRLLREGIAEAQRWEIICKLSLGIAKGLDHLHAGHQKPIVHGNLRSDNIMLDANLQPRLSDFGLHLLLNRSAMEDMLDASALQGYKAPEVIKAGDVSRESDIYSLGVVLLEMLIQKEPIDGIEDRAYNLHLPASFKDLILEQKTSDAFRSEIFRQSKNTTNKEALLKYFQLATSCCSPSPTLRPDTKQIIKQLEEIAS